MRYILKKDAMHSINQMLHLPADGTEQDWEIELGEARRIEEFFELLENGALGEEEKRALFALIFGSIECKLDAGFNVDAEISRASKLAQRVDPQIFEDWMQYLAKKEPNSVEISGVDPFKLDYHCELNIDCYVPVMFQTYRTGIGARYIRLGNKKTTLLELLVGPEDLRLRAVTLLRFDDIHQPIQLPTLPRSLGLPMLKLPSGLKFGGNEYQQTVDIPIEHSVGLGTDFLEIKLEDISLAEEILYQPRMEFLIGAGRLLGMRVVNLNEKEREILAGHIEESIRRVKVDKIVQSVLAELGDVDYDNFELILTIAGDLINGEELELTPNEKIMQKELALAATRELIRDYVVPGSRSKDWTQFVPWNLSLEEAMNQIEANLAKHESDLDRFEKIVWFKLKESRSCSK